MRSRLFGSMLLIGMIFSIQGNLIAVSSPSVPNVEVEPGAKSLEHLTAQDVVLLKRKEIEKKIGRKLKFKERLALVVTKKEIKRELKKGKSMEELNATFVPPGTGIHWGGFLLGLFLTAIGVLIAHLVWEKGSRGRKWAWIGGIISIVILGTALIV